MELRRPTKPKLRLSIEEDGTTGVDGAKEAAEAMAVDEAVVARGASAHRRSRDGQRSRGGSVGPRWRTEPWRRAKSRGAMGPRGRRGRGGWWSRSAMASAMALATATATAVDPARDETERGAAPAARPP